MQIDSKLILTSKNRETGVSLYTFVLTYPRVILAEVNTHRMLSRNTASSRAIPAKKQRSRVLAVPFVPVTIGKNQKGMQAGEELTGWRRAVAINTWKLARYPMVLASWILEKVGAHKQVVNRLVETWTWTEQVVTCTDLKNVFKLRNHSDAEPHFQLLAEQMQRQVEYVETLFDVVNFDSRNPDGSACALDCVNPTMGVLRVQMLRPGEWHMPFVDERDVKGLQAELDAKQIAAYGTLNDGHFKLGAIKWDDLKQISVARCARVSYYLPESGARSSFERDLELCSRLSDSGHWSPFEHVATPVPEKDYIGNFFSWKQYRKEYPEEHGGDR
jgi:thymidylate synthase ThyX